MAKRERTKGQTIIYKTYIGKLCVYKLGQILKFSKQRFH